MKIDLKKLEDLASTLHAFEDPDSEIPFLDQKSEEFKTELQTYKTNYKTLSQVRKKGLKNAVVWLIIQQTKDNQEVEEFIPDFYRRIWIHEPNTQATEEIINELDSTRYTKAIKYILNQAKSL